MTRYRNWIGWIAMAVVLSLLLVLFFRSLVPQRSADRPQPRSQARAQSADQEHRYKTEAVRRDREATLRLLADTCAGRLGGLLSRDRQNGGAPLDEQMDRLLKNDRRIQAIAHVSPYGRLFRGSLPATVKQQAARHLMQAEAAVASRQDYQSGVLALGRRSYVISAVHDPGAPGGFVALIRADHIGEVVKHQHRTLRLVPYPAEGRYRTESAESHSLKDTTVRSGEDNQRVSHYHINEAVVRFRSNPDKRTLNRMSRDVGAISVRKLGNTYVFRSTKLEAKAMMSYFRTKWRPAYVEPHYLYLTNEAQPALPDYGLPPIVPNDILYSRYQWNLPSIRTERGWNVSRGNPQVVVAAIDTGIQRDHPDLTGKIVPGINIVDKTKPPEDDVGHGTHVAGIIAANVNNGVGVAGLSWYNRIMPVKALDSSGAGSTYSVAEGIIWATDHGAKVINMSLGNYATAQFLHDAIKYAYDRDVVLVAASGNDNTDKPSYPAAYPEVFAVAATDSNGSRASFSNYGNYVDAAAPGQTIPSTYPGSQYVALSGTSMASPHAAALAALIRSANPELTNVQVMDLMRRTAYDMGAKGPDPQYGYGQIDIESALEAAQQPSTSLLGFLDRVARRLSMIQQRFGLAPK